MTSHPNLGNRDGTKIQDIEGVPALYNAFVSLEKRNLSAPRLPETLRDHPAAIFRTGGKTIDRIIEFFLQLALMPREYPRVAERNKLPLPRETYISQQSVSVECKASASRIKLCPLRV